MSPTIRTDPACPSGGHALLEGSVLAGVTAVTIEDVSSSLFLSANGRWAKLPHPFPVESQGEALRLGPAIVDHVPEELLVALRSDDGRDLGRLFWQGVMPSRGRTVAAPHVPIPPASEAMSAEALPSRPSLAPPGVAAEPVPVRAAEVAPVRPADRRWAPAGVALVALLVACGAWALLHGHAPSPALPLPSSPPQDRASRCVRDFGARATTARAGSDDDRVKAAEAALAAGCGPQAFAALDGADWEMSEAAAWHLAHFYDPNETDAAVRAAAAPHPDWAAAYYSRWASRVPREAAALKQLCTTDAAVLDANAQLKRACGR